MRKWQKVGETLAKALHKAEVAVTWKRETGFE